VLSWLDSTLEKPVPVIVTKYYYHQTPSKKEKTSPNNESIKNTSKNPQKTGRPPLFLCKEISDVYLLSFDIA
jgi:hypothetical protein